MSIGPLIIPFIFIPNRIQTFCHLKSVYYFCEAVTLETHFPLLEKLYLDMKKINSNEAMGEND